MYGKIENGILTQKQPDPAPGFVQVPDEAICGMTYDDQSGEWHAPQPDLQTAKNHAVSVLNRNHSVCVAECRGYYDNAAERETWDLQKKEAEAYTDDPVTAVTPFMDAFVSANPNMSKAQLAATIIANAAAMAEAAGDLGGQLSAKRAAILAAATVAEVEAVDPTITKPAINLTDK